MTTPTKITKKVTDFGDDHATRITNLETELTSFSWSPSTWTVTTGQVLAKKADVDELEWVTITGSGAASFENLTDTPSFTDAADGDYLRKKALVDELEWVAPPAPPIDEFTELTDTPETYVGYHGYYLIVNEDSGTLEFTQPPQTGATTFLGLADTPEEWVDDNAFDLVRVSSTANSLEFVDPADVFGITNIQDLANVPALQRGLLLQVNSQGDAITYTDPASLGSGLGTFLGMPNTTEQLAGNTLGYLRCNLGETSLEFEPFPAIPDDLLDLTGSPATWGTSGYVLSTDGAGSLSWVANSGSVVDFEDLSNVPATFAGAAGDLVVVNGTPDGLEYLDGTAFLALHDPLELDNMPASYTLQAGKVLAVNQNEDGFEFVDNTGGGTDSASPSPILVAVTDETSTVTGGAAKVTFRAPGDFTLSDIKASLTTASSSGNVAIDVNVGGTTVFSTGLTIDAGSKTSVGATTPAVLSTTSISDDDEFTIDIDSAGTGAVGLKIYLILA